MVERGYSMCSDFAVRSLATKLAHRRLKEADENGEPTLGKFGSFLSEAYREVRSLAESMAQDSECQLLTFDGVRNRIEEEAEGDVELSGEDEMDREEVDDKEIELGPAEEIQEDDEGS